MKELFIAITGLLMAAILYVGFKEYPAYEKNYLKKDRLYTAYDSTGKSYSDLTFVGDGWGYAAFKTKDGKRLVLEGNFSYKEQ